METLQVHCPAIHCEGCANAIRRALSRLAGVESVDVEIERKNVLIRYDPAQIKEDRLREHLEQAGYAAE